MVSIFSFIFLELCSLLLIWITSFFMIKTKKILIFIPFFILGMGAGASNYIFLFSNWENNPFLRYFLDFCFLFLSFY
jgi:hypothetical protein